MKSLLIILVSLLFISVFLYIIRYDLPGFHIVQTVRVNAATNEVVLATFLYRDGDIYANWECAIEHVTDSTKIQQRRAAENMIAKIKKYENQ